MRITKKHKLIFMPIAAVVAVTSLALILINPGQSSSQTVTNDICSSRLSIIAHSPSSTTIGTLTGVVDVVVAIPTGCPDISKVTVFSNNAAGSDRQLIGQALQGFSQYTWTYRWNTATRANGSVKLSADVYLLGANSPIATNSEITYAISNPLVTTGTTSDTTSPSTSTTTTNTTTNNGTTASPSKVTEPATQVTSSTSQNSVMTKGCIEGIITGARYELINSGTTRPTTAELARIQNCFATANYILPAAFSPIAPQTAKELKVEKTVTVKKPENVTKKDAYGNKKETLKLAGVAAANTTVYLYIFSDPLVITTSTDSDGNWQYTLEDPLEPGEHEVYAVVDKGDGSYRRSDPTAFVISTAGATAVNPDGLSLSLAKSPTATPVKPTGSMTIYIAGSVILLVIVLAGMFFVIRSRRKKVAPQTGSDIDQVNMDSTTSDPMPTETDTDTANQLNTPDDTNPTDSSDTNP